MHTVTQARAHREAADVAACAADDRHEANPTPENAAALRAACDAFYAADAAVVAANAGARS